jgi:hypothetical protein
MTAIPVFDVITGVVLCVTEQAHITRRTHPNGTRNVHLDGHKDPLPEHSLPMWALTTLEHTGRIEWLHCNANLEVAQPTVKGVDDLLAWKLEFFGLTELPTSDRPLADPVCLDDLAPFLAPHVARELTAGFDALDKRNERK